MENNSNPFVNIFVFLITFMHVSNISSYVLSMRIGLVQWHFWAVGIAGCILLAILSRNFLKISQQALIYLLWCVLFMSVCLLSLFVVDSGAVAIQAFVSYGWFFGISFALVALVRSENSIRAAGQGVVAAVILLGVLTIMEFLNPDFQVIVDVLFEDETTVGVTDRASSFYTNSNVTGIAMVLGMFVGQFFVPKSLRFLFFVFVLVAVFGTVSRGSLTLWAVATVTSFVFGFLAPGGAFTRLIGVGFVAALGYLLVSGQIPSYLLAFGVEDLMSEGMTQRLSENFFTQGDGSSEGRVLAALEAWQIFIDNPLTGIGIGSTDILPETGIGAHNQHLKVAAELGILGYLVFLGLLFIAIASHSAAAILFVGLFFIISFTNHTLLDFTVFAVLIPIALVFIPALKRFQKEKKRSKRKRRRRTSSRMSSSSVANH